VVLVSDVNVYIGKGVKICNLPFPLLLSSLFFQNFPQRPRSLKTKLSRIICQYRSMEQTRGGKGKDCKEAWNTSSDDHIFVLYLGRFPVSVSQSIYLTTHCPLASARAYSRKEQFHLADVTLDVGGFQDVIRTVSKVTYMIDTSSCIRLMSTLYKLRNEKAGNEPITFFVLENVRTCLKNVANEMNRDDIMDSTHVFESAVLLELSKCLERWSVIVTSFYVLSATAR